MSMRRVFGGGAARLVAHSASPAASLSASQSVINLAPRAATLSSPSAAARLISTSTHLCQQVEPQDTHAKRNESYAGTSGAVTGPHFKDLHNVMANPVYESHELELEPQHKPVRTSRDFIANGLVSTARKLFDYCTDYGEGKMNERKWLTRFLFLESVAGVPGLVGGACRHLRSLRLMRRDHGWINSLLQEAENERMHLMTFMQMRQGTGILMRLNVFLAQGVFFNLFFFSYLLSPRTCHSFVGFLEEEAVKTYTTAIQDLDAGKLPQWENQRAPQIAIDYWKMNEDATVRDLLLNVRADEAHHSHVNHTASALHADSPNPFIGKSPAVPKNFTEPPEEVKKMQQ